MKILFPVLLVLVGLLQIAGATAAMPTGASARQKKPPKTKIPAKRTAPKIKRAQKPAAKPASARKVAAPPKKQPVKIAPVKKTPARQVTQYKPAPPVDPTEGDNVDADDLTVRRAAVDALGTLNGAVVAVDPSNGRVLSMVNQKLALKSGFVPCSTIKLVTALAALSEGVIEPETSVHVSRFASFNLTTAIAHSNNPYFQRLGNQLGYDRVTHYARMLGLGEKAGLDISGPDLGRIRLPRPAGSG
jgi:membrane carboxypeptidase/penicillin-binding protein